jgi:FkbH-like protein
MKPQSDVFQRALQMQSRAEVFASLLPGRPVMTLPELQQLTRHLESFHEPARELRLALLHTYTSDLLDPYVTFEARLQGFEPAVYHGPYGAIVADTAPDSGLVRHAPHLTVLMLRWDDLDPRLARPLAALPGTEREDVADTACTTAVHHAGLVRQAVGGHLLVTLLPVLESPGLGDYDVNAPGSEHAWRTRVKTMIASALTATLASTTFLDLDETLATLGRERFFDRRLWYTARFPFSPAAAQDVVRRIVTVATVLRRPRAKVIALDADNTLWGGVVGEEGIDGIALGPDYPGNAYVAFQRRLLDYQQRGFLLALCSKNNERDVLEVLRQHPHQLLREEHFAAMRVNWSPKPENLQALAEELSLGLDAFVFVDDSVHECLAVKQSLPDVEVVQLPARALDVPACLDRIPRLETVALTEEDRRKTEMYAQERQRRTLAAATTDLASYLRSLQMEMSVGVDDARQIRRIAQLTQKTNQFTLTTRRYSEEDIARLMQADDAMVVHFSLRDVFGESGLVGVAIVRLVSAGTAELDSLLMSCRVIGRKAETAFLESVLALARQRDVKQVLADYLPTAKNALVAGFLTDHGFREQADGRFERALDSSPPGIARDLPIIVHLSGDVAAVEV